MDTINPTKDRAFAAAQKPESYRFKMETIDPTEDRALAAAQQPKSPSQRAQQLNGPCLMMRTIDPTADRTSVSAGQSFRLTPCALNRLA